LLEQVRLLGVGRVLHHLFDGFEGLLPVLHDEVHQLVEVEELVLGGEGFAVEFAVEILHRGGL
jgi:hypothetical protein